MTLLASFQALLHLLTAQDDISIGVSVANRTHAEMERLIGFFVNILILRTDLSGNPTFRTLLQRVRETTLNAYSHQNLLFDRLIALLEPERAKHANPLVTVGFDYQKDKKQLLQLPDLHAEFIELENGRPQFDLTLRIIDEGHLLYGRLDYKASMFQEKLILAMLEHYGVLLQEIAAHPEAPLLEIMPAASGSAQVEHSAHDGNFDVFAFETNI
jgi:non-ribosomal peptide synthetase component F